MVSLDFSKLLLLVGADNLHVVDKVSDLHTKSIREKDTERRVREKN